jgi:hypothetical protein
MDRPLRIDFVLHSDGYVKMFEPTLRLLAARGHAVRLVPDRRVEHDSWAMQLTGRLVADCPTISVEPLELGDEEHDWTRLFSDLSRSLDYVRYFEPRFARATALRERAGRSAPPTARRVMAGPLGRTRFGRAAVGAVLRMALDATPTGPGVRAWLRGRRPDLLLLSPVVDGRRQPEFVRAARELGIPAVACVRSWDNLSTKGLFLEAPDRVTVWNETMRREAVEMHHVPADRVVTTGAQNFDVWFDRGPRLDREAFMRARGLDPERPLVLYLCSSKFISGPREPEWVARWLAAVRAHPAMDGIGVLVRPHPKSGEYWRDVDLGPNTAVYPPVGSETDTPQAQDVFYDSIHHAAAVVGVNTSALIESAIIGRPVLSVLAPEFRNSQEDSIHFSYLRTVGGGALVVDETLEGHVARLARVVEGTEAPPDTTPFVHEFVRPHGLDRPAAPILAEALESTAELAVEPRAAPAWAALLRPGLRLLAWEDARRSRIDHHRAKVERRRRAKRWRRRARLPLRWARLAYGIAASALSTSSRGDR